MDYETLYMEGQFDMVTILFVSILCLDLWCQAKYWECFYEKKSKWLLRVLATWLIFNFGISQLISFTPGIPNVSYLLGVFMLSITAYKSAGIKKVFLCLLYLLLSALSEVLVALVIVYDPGDPFLQDIGSAFSVLVRCVIVFILCAWTRRKQTDFLPLPYLLAFSSIIIGFLYILWQNMINSFHFTFTLFGILSLLTMIIFEFFLQANSFIARERESVIRAQQLQMVAQNTEEQKLMMQDFFEQRHNFVNELIVLKSELEHNDKEAVRENLDKLISSRNRVDVICTSGNSTVDAIINFKYAAAKESGIAFDLKLFIPPELPIAQSDLGVILGNAVDNAIEAVKQCSTKQKVIEISMGVKKGACILVIKNPYEGKLETGHEGIPLTTKEQKKRHGYGLKSIFRIAEEYEGEAVIDAAGGTFSLTVVLNMNRNLKTAKASD